MKNTEKTVKDCGGIPYTQPHKLNGLTELVFIIDRSGSMAGYEEDTVGGFNATIEKQRAKEGRVLVSTVLFDNDNEVIHDRADIADVLPMTVDDYCVGGGTALLDAIGGAIHHIGNLHKYGRAEDVPDHTVFVITTDGFENASRRYTYADIKAKIKRQTERYGWEFIFLAANIDACREADNLGIRRDRAANYRRTREGVTKSYYAVCEAISSVRECRSGDIDLERYLEEDEK